MDTSDELREFEERLKRTSLGTAGAQSLIESVSTEEAQQVLAETIVPQEEDRQRGKSAGRKGRKKVVRRKDAGPEVPTVVRPEILRNIRTSFAATSLPKLRELTITPSALGKGEFTPDALRVLVGEKPLLVRISSDTPGFAHILKAFVRKHASKAMPIGERHFLIVPETDPEQPIDSVDENWGAERKMAKDIVRDRDYESLSPERRKLKGRGRFQPKNSERLALRAFALHARGVALQQIAWRLRVSEASAARLIERGRLREDMERGITSAKNPSGHSSSKDRRRL
ncbi:hypothetical protein [uncultured Serinicoccus sp.]|uniref:hypothetical protein n=1 Tax=uncultured Serinicoccus sp. TaxID=735514 RepID=UPI00263670A9|nr:hypothetical protein [uncultured Serinicoccus sp.]